MPAIRDVLPPLYRSLLRAPFDVDVPAESKATCASCAMLEANCGPAARAAPVDGVPRFFRPDTKCCTFHPRLPNYLVGAILDDASAAGAEGRARVEARIASGVGVTPAWLHPPRTFHVLYDGARGAFGRAEGLRCPYYAVESGGCTIWAHREAVCATYHCKYVAGEDGRRMWSAAKELLSLVEIQLGRLALLELMPEALDAPAAARTAAAPLGPEDIDGAPPPERERRAAWGRWRGREAEFYRGCHALVSRLRPAELEAALGLDGVVARRQLAQAMARASSPSLPPVLRLDPRATVRWLPDGTIALAAYSELEALALPAEAWPLLLRFTGEEPVAAVRSRLRAEARADLDDEVLLALFRHRILAEPLE
ncbi:MAG TPA: hypothetical protein VFP65_29815 [Anaeromyxobacteraceae bacterium]|nr:hypothetical protein [Anaeromyxobacteraceae bacterium]